MCYRMDFNASGTTGFLETVVGRRNSNSVGTCSACRHLASRRTPYRRRRTTETSTNNLLVSHSTSARNASKVACWWLPSCRVRSVRLYRISTRRDLFTLLPNSRYLWLGGASAGAKVSFVFMLLHGVRRYNAEAGSLSSHCSNPIV